MNSRILSRESRLPDAAAPHTRCVTGPSGVAVAPPDHGIDFLGRITRADGSAARIPARNIARDRVEPTVARDRVEPTVARDRVEPTVQEEPVQDEPVPEEIIQAKKAEHSVPGAPAAPLDPPRNHAVMTSVREVLGRSGRAMEPAVRRPMEALFGRDLSQVRLHTDHDAARSADSLGARAYTHGEHIAFAAGHYAPHRPGGRYLLAHELAHVAQQGARSEVATKLVIGEPDCPAEREADAAAERVMNGQPVEIRRAPGGESILRRFSCCAHLLNATEAAAVPESEVQAELWTRMARRFGPTEVQRELYIPDASFGAHRTPGTSLPRSGFADIALRRRSRMELMEVKRATWADPMGNVIDAEMQVNNYVRKGNANPAWLASQGVTALRTMPMTRWTPPSPIPISGEQVSLAWCTDGVMSFKAVGDYDDNTFVCGTTDQGAIDDFLDRATSRGTDIVSDFIDSTLGPAMDRAIRSMSLGSLLRWMAHHPETQQLLDNLLPGLGASASTLPVERIQEFLTAHIDARIEATIRSLALTFKDRLLAAVRRHIRQLVRAWIQNGITALCVGAEAIAMSRLMDWLRRNMARLVVVAMAAEAVALVSAFIAELAAEVALILAATLAAVLVILLLWEVIIPALIAAVQGATAIELLGAALAVLRGLVIPLLRRAPAL